MTITLSILLIPYLLFLIMFFIFSFFNFYHILKFGFKDKISIFMISFFVILTIIILVITFIFALNINWSEKINPF